MPGPAQLHPLHALRATTLSALLALTTTWAGAQTLSITGLGAEVKVSTNSDADLDGIVFTRGTETVANEDQFQWASAGLQAGTVKYLTHVNTTQSGAPILESSGAINSGAAGAVFYRFSNEGSTPITLPAGALQWSLSSVSGSYRPPAMDGQEPFSMTNFIHQEYLAFGFDHEVANDSFDAYLDTLVANGGSVQPTHLALGVAMNSVTYFSPLGVIQDGMVFIEDPHKPEDVDFDQIGALNVTTNVRGVTLDMSLVSDQAVTIAPGTSRLFAAISGSGVLIQPDENSTSELFSYVFKDSSHSATLSLTLPEGITLVGEQPSWVSAVPEASSVGMALAGALGVLGARGRRGLRQGRVRHQTTV